MMDPKQLEKYSSAISLSDMEIFVFPELMYSLVLANIMSPVLWRWREEETFRKLEGKSPYRRLMRLKQFIMDEFDFNLDLETWGLTDKDTEMERFAPFIPPEEIAASNALFGYTGDKYYFDVDIRRHFGLDKYDTDVIPYWKTETVEAMQAFALKEHYAKPAGECVSLAALYAAAAFVVCGIPLEDIFMILTPLHSQNFLDLQDGVLTNNRRIVTKSMWFNGTEITYKAQRALRNENVTIVAHCSGYVHCLYEQATIERADYERFQTKLADYLSADLTLTLFASFLRTDTQYQKYFQVCRNCHGQAQFLKAEQLYAYEHGSKFRVGDETFDKLLAEVSDDDYTSYEIPGRLRCDRLCSFLSENNPDLHNEKDRELFKQLVAPVIPEVDAFMAALADFVHMTPRLPSADKTYATVSPITLTADMDREAVIAYLQSQRENNTTADLAFYVFRDMARCDWQPFIKTAMERCPVAVQAAKTMSLDQVYAWLQGLRDESIYDAQRLAQPDEVVNFLSGDGLEKAFVLVGILRARNPHQEVEIQAEGDCVCVIGGGEYHFSTSKGLDVQLRIDSTSAIYVSGP